MVLAVEAERLRKDGGLIPGALPRPQFAYMAGESHVQDRYCTF